MLKPITESRANHIQSLDRGLQLLEFLSQSSEPMGLAELAGLLRVDRSTAHRLLGTLAQRDFVRQDPESKHYSLGLKVVELSRRAVDGLTLRIVARDRLRHLVHESGESVNLVVMVRDQVVCVDAEPSPAVLAVSDEVGAIYALHATAAGKILLAHLPDAQRTNLLSREPLPGYTLRTLTDLNTLQAHLQLVRQQGYALDDEERFSGVRCVAAPVRDRRSKVVAAISISGPATRITLEKVPELAGLVKKTASDISTALGYTPN
ncbi:MAG: IclR family transcriptional regulator [Anaerolineae bacterium]|nr:IclR family transcriptional regulator [Anaerolineae bacterium]